MRFTVQQKNRKRSTVTTPTTQARQQRYPVALPDIVSIDVLAVTSDEELIGRLRLVEDDRQRVLDAYLDPRPWEDEAAYVRRELQIRRGRRDAHDRYVRQLEREFAESEANLPVADLDNTHFLRFIGEIN